MAERSWRAGFYLEVEVSAPDQEAAILAARAVARSGNYDAEQLDFDDIREVDPLTGQDIDDPTHSAKEQA